MWKERGRGGSSGFGSRDCNPSKERVDHTLSQGLNISRWNINFKIENVRRDVLLVSFSEWTLFLICLVVKSHTLLHLWCRKNFHIVKPGWFTDYHAGTFLTETPNLRFHYSEEALHGSRVVIRVSYVVCRQYWQRNSIYGSNIPCLPSRASFLQRDFCPSLPLLPSSLCQDLFP